MEVSSNKVKYYRFLEMIPGFLSWTIILLPLWGSFVFPEIVAYYVIGFLMFWFYQSFKSAFFAICGYLKIKKASATDWQKMYRQDKSSSSGKNWLEWKQVKHVVIIPNAYETADKITNSVESLKRQVGIDKKQLIVVLAMEARANDCHQKAQTLLKRYRHSFGKIITTFHPMDIVGEIKGKASNEAWAAKVVKKEIIDKESWDLRTVTVTSCDADAKFDPHYFSALTYFFAKDQSRYLKFWQSPIFWYNNLDRVPSFTRIIGKIGHIMHIAQLLDPAGMFFNYSTYSLSFKLLDDVGYWDTDIIPEDWHIFLQSFFAKKGKVAVNPIFLPTNIDAPEGKTFAEALKNRYLQCQRHAWGATDIPYAIYQSFQHPEIPWFTKILRLFKIMETHLIWSTNWFILTLGSSLPAILNPKFMQTSLGYNLPRFSQTILTICLVAILVTIIIDFKLRPKEAKNKGIFSKLLEIGEWLFMPVATLFMSVLPGLDAQTRLMIGKRLEYKVTEKF